MVNASAPEGQPYLPLRHSFSWPGAASKQRLELKLPRGVLLRGKINDASGTPIAQASLQYLPRRDNPNVRQDVPTGWTNVVVSQADGTFSICVLPGVGHLVIHAPTADFVLHERGQREIANGRRGGVRYRAHAFVPLDLKPGADSQALAVKLERGVTVKGRIVGPDGKPVAEALLISHLHIIPGQLYWRGFPIKAHDGRFEIHGLDPQTTCRVYFLDPKRKLGATVELSAKQAGEDVAVRLQPCGSVSRRVVDAMGKPLARQQVNLQMVVTPGLDPHTEPVLSGKTEELAADSDFVANIDRLNHWKDPLTDEQGRVTLGALIPGATYHILGDGKDGLAVVAQEFTVESGKTRQLPDLVRKE